ncbi:MAG TPA: alpha/beta hydrolase [Candidatus Limnocylindrales bacterium]|nr:alpha/beta hydrolase [Candidatus Limnocylindrales bacterium]
MARTIVFLHGAWVTAACWERMQPWFEARGYRTLAPSWPGKDRPVEAIRADPSALAGLGVGEIVAAYEKVVRGLEQPPILIGHSFGGLFTQILLDRGLGAAGVAIDSAPPRGIWAFEPTAVRSLITVLLQWPWRKVARWKYSNFRYAFVSALPDAEARAAYDRHVVPETIRIFFQSAVALMNPKSPIRVNFANATRAPLLLIAGGKDRIVPPVINRRNYRAYAKSPARTDFKEFPGRVHWIIAQGGWEEVAEHIANWLEQQGLVPEAARP